MRVNQVAMKQSLANKTITEEQHKRHVIFILWFGQLEYLPTPRCGVPMDEGCTQPLSSDPMINLNTTTFFLIVFLPFARNLHKLEPLVLTLEFHKEARSKGGMSNAHKTRSQNVNTHTSRNKSSQHNSMSSQLNKSSRCYHNEPNARNRCLGA